MKPLKEKLSKTYVEVIRGSAIKNPPQCKVNNKSGRAMLSSNYLEDEHEILIGRDYINKSYLDFVIAHELGHYERRHSGYKSIERDMELDSCIKISAVLGAVLTSFALSKGEGNGVIAVYIAGFFTALASMCVATKAAFSYIEEFKADRFAAEKTSPHQGVECFSDSSQKNLSLWAKTKDLLVHPPNKWRKMAMERMARKNEGQDSYIEI